jgi:hypothetical protein
MTSNIITFDTARALNRHGLTTTGTLRRGRETKIFCRNRVTDIIRRAHLLRQSRLEPTGLRLGDHVRHVTAGDGFILDDRHCPDTGAIMSYLVVFGGINRFVKPADLTRIENTAGDA